MKDWLNKMYAMTLDDANKLMADVECADCARIVHNVNKHPAWVIGHLAVAGDMMGNMLGDAPELEPWYPLFAPGPDSAPVEDRSKYPKKAELMDALADRHAALSARVAGLDDSALAAPLPVEAYREFWPTVGDAAGYMLAYHEGYHLGQLTQWKRAAGLAG